MLELTDAAGKRLAFNDDYEDKADGLHTHHADSLIDFTLPADGTYYLRLGTPSGRAGRSLPTVCGSARRGPILSCASCPPASMPFPWRLTPITVFALRKDGFSGDIALASKTPGGNRDDGGVVPDGQDRVRVTLAVAPWLPAEPIASAWKAVPDRR